MTKHKHHIAIIGGGLTGLTLAYYLRKAGLDTVVLERKERVGGVINTLREDGFLFETGPNTGVISSPELVQLFDELKGKIEVETANEDAKYRWILKNGRWHPLPFSLKSAVMTPLFTLKDKFRILGEPFRKPGSNPNETVAELVMRRMGKSFLDYAIDPFISGIYAGDPNHLVTRYALPKLHALEQNYGSFIKGSMAKRKEPKTELEKRVGREVFSIKGGLVQMMDALADEIGRKNIYLSCRDLEIQNKKEGFKVSYLDGGKKPVSIIFDKVISTVPGTKLDQLLPFIDDDQKRDLTNIKYAKVVQVVAGYKKWKGITLRAFGGLVPTKEKRHALGILFPASIFPNRAPKDGAILSIFMGGTKRPEMILMEDEDLKDLALKEIKETLRTDEAPELIKVYRYNHAIPQYEVSSKQRFTAIEKIQNQYPGLILAGNIRDGIGIPDRVKQATQIAMNLID